MTPQFQSAVEEFGPRFMSDLGLTKLQTAGIFGNYAVETGQFRLLQEQKPLVKGSRGGWGWAQWTGPRRVAFERWADENGYKRNDSEAFYQYTLLELRGSEKAALARLKRTTTLDSATNAFMLGYERPGIPHLDKRKAYALEALQVLEAKLRAQGGPVASRPAPARPRGDRMVVSPTPIATITPVAQPDAPPTAIHTLPNVGPLRYLWDRIRGKSPLPPATLPPAAATEDNPVLVAQTRLKALGYTEVGWLDGLYGNRTRAAVLAFQADNGLSATGAVDDVLLAALARGRTRVMEPQRVVAQKADLRETAPEVTKQLDGLGLIGKLIFSASGIGAVNASGALESVKAVADQATETVASVKTIADGAVGAVQWAVAHWWIIGLVAGLYILGKVGMAGVRLVVLLRQGRLL